MKKFWARGGASLAYPLRSATDVYVNKFTHVNSLPVVSIFVCLSCNRNIPSKQHCTDSPCSTKKKNTNKKKTSWFAESYLNQHAASYVFAGESYYAVAVVHKDNEAWTFRNLKGKKSCHTGVRKTSGWNVPIGYMINAGIMDVQDCQGDIKAAGSFFNQSCAPGKELAPPPPQGIKQRPRYRVTLKV